MMELGLITVLYFYILLELNMFKHGFDDTLHSFLFLHDEIWGNHHVLTSLRTVVLCYDIQLKERRKWEPRISKSPFKKACMFLCDFKQEKDVKKFFMNVMLFSLPFMLFAWSSWWNFFIELTMGFLNCNEIWCCWIKLDKRSMNGNKVFSRIKFWDSKC